MIDDLRLLIYDLLKLVNIRLFCFRFCRIFFIL